VFSFEAVIKKSKWKYKNYHFEFLIIASKLNRIQQTMQTKGE